MRFVVGQSIGGGLKGIVVPGVIAIEACFELAKARLEFGRQVATGDLQQVIGVGIGQPFPEPARVGGERARGAAPGDAGFGRRE